MMIFSFSRELNKIRMKTFLPELFIWTASKLSCLFWPKGKSFRSKRWREEMMQKMGWTETTCSFLPLIFCCCSSSLSLSHLFLSSSFHLLSHHLRLQHFEEDEVKIREERMKRLVKRMEEESESQEGPEQQLLSHPFIFCFSLFFLSFPLKCIM